MPDRKRGPAEGLRRARSRASDGHGGSVGIGQERGLKMVPPCCHAHHQGWCFRLSGIPGRVVRVVPTAENAGNHAGQEGSPQVSDQGAGGASPSASSSASAPWWRCQAAKVDPLSFFRSRA